MGNPPTNPDLEGLQAVTVLSRRAFLSPMVRRVVLKQISYGWFWRLGFGKHCSADDRSFSLEVSDICWQCRPIVGVPVSVYVMDSQARANSDWLAISSLLSLLLKNVHHQILLKLTCCMHGGKLNTSSRLLASFVVSENHTQSQTQGRCFKLTLRGGSSCSFFLLKTVTISVFHTDCHSHIRFSQSVLHYKRFWNFTPVTQAWISHAEELIECWRTSWKWPRHF